MLSYKNMETGFNSFSKRSRSLPYDLKDINIFTFNNVQFMHFQEHKILARNKEDIIVYRSLIQNCIHLWISIFLSKTHSPGHPNILRRD